MRDCLGYADIIELPGGPHLLISLVDITERKQAERQLRDSEERFRLVVENSPSSIFLWDEEGAIRYVSPAFATMLGWAPEAITGQAALQEQLAALEGADHAAASLAGSLGIDVRYVYGWLDAGGCQALHGAPGREGADRRAAGTHGRGRAQPDDDLPGVPAQFGRERGGGDCA